MAYDFYAPTIADMPMLRRWLAEPHVGKVWAGLEEQCALVEEDLSNPLMAQAIYRFGGRPFGYIQHYPVHAWPQHHLDHLPPGSVAVDCFVGELAGQGHGAAMIRLLAERLKREGVPEVATDPHLWNAAGLAAYARAGFVKQFEADTDDGRVAVMVFRA